MGTHAARLADRQNRRRLARDSIRSIASSYDDLVTRLYAQVRFTILRQPFLEEIGQHLPDQGDILDLGCGFGLFSLYYGAMSPERSILGVDLDRGRIAAAARSAGRLGITNVRYETDDAVAWTSSQRFDAVYFLDLVHHLPADSVPAFLTKVRSLLREGGRLVIKDVADRPRWKMLFTLALDRLMVGREPIRYWSSDELSSLLESLGFSVFSHRMTDVLPYPHILYVASLQGRQPP